MNELQCLKDELKLIQEAENTCNDKIVKLLDCEPILKQQINQCSDYIDELKTFSKEITVLKKEIEDLNSNGQHISHKIRKLKKTKLQVAQCIRLIHDIEELISLKDSTNNAIDDEDFEEASACIRRYHLRQLNYLQGSEHDDANDACYSIEQCEKKMCMIAETRFNQSMAVRDIPQAMRFLKIFSLLSLYDIGIAKFSEHVLSELNNKLNKNSFDGNNSMEIVQQIELLLDTIAELIEAHIPIFETYYDPSRLIDFISTILSECTFKYSNLIDSFKRTTKLDEYLSDIIPKVEISKQFENDEALLDQLCFILQHSEMFLRFVQRKLCESTRDDILFVDQWIQKCKFKLIVQELACCYIPIEGQFVEHSIEKTCKLHDQTPVSNSMKSTLIDDIFFVLQKSICRALNSSNTEGFCAILNNCISTLDRFRQQHLLKRIKQGCSSNLQFVSAMLSNQPKKSIPDDKLINFLNAINNLQYCIYGIEAMSDRIQTDVCQQSFLPSEINKIQSCQKEFERSAEQFSIGLQNGWNKLQRDFIKPIMDRIGEEFIDTNHKINEDIEFSQENKFVVQCTKEILTTYNTLKELVIDSHHNTLLSLVVTELVISLERAIKSSKFNQRGGLLLEQEIRTLVTFVSKLSDLPLRRQFLRLNRISRLLI